MDSFDLLGAVAPGEVNARACKIVSRDGLEQLGLFAPDDELGNRCRRSISIGEVTHQQHDAVRLRIRERLEEHGVDDRKNSCIGPDAQGHRHHGGRKEPRAPPECPAGVLNVLEQTLDEVCYEHR